VATSNAETRNQITAAIAALRAASRLAAATGATLVEDLQHVP
jgi:hypothetical protein